MVVDSNCFFSLSLLVLVAVFPGGAIAADAADLDLEQRFQINLEKARNGDMMAQHKLAAMYEQGNGVPKDMTLAFKWYERSSKQGNIKAEYQVGFMYFLGNGVGQDLPQAKAIFERVARKGYVAAQYMLGHMYEKGTGVPVNIDLAQQWYVRAANSGYLNAKYALKKLDEDAAKERLKPSGAAVSSRTAVAAPVPPKPVAEDVAMLETPKQKTLARYNATSLPNASSLTASRSTSIYREPEIMRRRVNVKELVKTLMSGVWYDQKTPSRLLPSDKTTCEALKDGTVECMSGHLERKVDKVRVIYQTRTVLSDISDLGEFTLTYRNNVLDVVKPNKSEGFWDDATTPVRLGWQDTQHELQCRLGSDNSEISCANAGSGGAKLFTRKSGKGVKLSRKSKSSKR